MKEEAQQSQDERRSVTQEFGRDTESMAGDGVDHGIIVIDDRVWFAYEPLD